jgi:arylsulfatase A-like enzyme
VLEIESQQSGSDPALSSIWRSAMAGALACLLLSAIEWIDLNLRLTPIFESFWQRLAFSAYFSLNLLVGAAIGLIVGALAVAAGRLKGAIQRLMARGNRIRIWHRLVAGLGVLVAAAIGLKQLPEFYRYAMSLIREAEKIEAVRLTLLYHERAASYLLSFSFLAGCWLMWAVARAQLAAKRRALLIAALAAMIAAAYYADTRIEPQLYEYSFHRSMFLVGLALSMTLVGLASRFLPRFRRFMWLVAAILFVPSLAFTFYHFDRDHTLKTVVFYSSAQLKQHFKIARWVLDFDRDGWSAALGGGDADDRNPAVNPAQKEVVGDGIDNNCIGGDLRPEDLEAWRRELLAWRPAPNPNPRRFNIIYVFIDALRADHLSAYGYPRETSPNLKRLAARSVLFENAFTPAPNTFEALPKFMQSNYWDAHLESWTAMLSRNGYDCLLFPRRLATLLRHVKGMRVVQGAKGGIKQAVDAAIEILGARSKDQPFCAFIYATDPHQPYKKHDEFYFGPSPADLYDGEVAYVDFHLGRLFDHLERTGLIENTMIVIMSDHGESLGERGVWKHSSQLYNEQMRIPMIIHVPGLEPRRIGDYVSSIDLGATILDAVGIEQPKGSAGVSLLALMRGEKFAHPPIYGEQTSHEVSPYVQPWQNVNPEGKKYMVITQDGFKLIFNREAYSFELYDLKSDPREERNLYHRMPDKAEAMKKLLGRFIDVLVVSRPPDADESQYTFGAGREPKEEL